MTYTRHRETQDTLQTLERLDIDTDKKTEEELYEKFHLEEQYLSGTLTKWQKWKPKLWALIDEPYSSLYAKVSHLLHFLRFCHMHGVNINFACRFSA